jgi:NAD(P)H-dependent FMN reductase
MPRILAFAGSARTGSLNKKLVRVAAARTRQAGAELTEIDLRDFPMPLYDGDLESAEGPPEHATRLRSLMAEHDGFLIACPEYNSSITPLLKNTIDWISRPVEGEPPLVAFRGKCVALLAASPGRLGGLRGLVTVRSILGNLGVFVLPDQLAVPHARRAFAEDGSLADEGLGKKIDALVATLVDTTRKLGGR